MDLELTGKSVVVTCASSGVGLACATRLLHEGAEVVAVSRDVTPQTFGDAAGRERLHCVRADMNDGLRFEALLQEALDRLIVKPTMLVFVPLRESNLPLVAVDHDQVRLAMDRNFARFMFLVQRLLPHMRHAGFGRIVAILGASTLAPLPDHVLANVSRVAIASAVAGLGREYAEHNICANSLLLGVFDTPGLRALWEGRAESEGIDKSAYVARGTARIPARRFGRPEECAALCALLCSPSFGYLNGQNLLMDGGLNPNL